MIVIPGLTRPLKNVGKRIDDWRESDDRLWVEASGSARVAACPSCQRRSSQQHGSYKRLVDDRPCFGKRVSIAVKIRRFKCVNSNCTQRTFAERLDPLAASSQRRTRRLNDSLLSLGYALGGAAAARLAGKLGMNTSGDTVLRELRRAGCAAPMTPPVVVGIDDWAIKRGHRYGTVIVDLETRRPIEILGARERTVVATWLREHPSVEIVARDRAGAYSEAVCAARPGAQQVADRWHLLVNLQEAMERMLMRRTASLREAARTLNQSLQIEGQPVTADQATRVLRPDIWQRLAVQRREARLAQYEEVVRRQKLGETYKAIGRAMGLDQRTVSKFVGVGSFPERAPRTTGYTLMDGHRQYVASRIAEGCVRARTVWHELQARGFSGSLCTIRSAMARAYAASRIDAGLETRSIACPSSRRAYAWLVGWQRSKLCDQKSSDKQRYIDALGRIEPAIAVAGSLARHFLGLVHRRDVGGFDRWLIEARACIVPELRRFAVGIDLDLSAVRAAFTSPWSSGQVEGQVNRLKFLKRQMYGRAKLDLLRVRVLNPN